MKKKSLGSLELFRRANNSKIRYKGNDRLAMDFDTFVSVSITVAIYSKNKKKKICDRNKYI